MTHLILHTEECSINVLLTAVKIHKSITNLTIKFNPSQHYCTVLNEKVMRYVYLGHLSYHEVM